MIYLEHYTLGWSSSGSNSSKLSQYKQCILLEENGEIKTYDVVGNICESADFFAKDREIAEIREGDILDIQIAGAYGMSMASEYQFRSRPAEILIQKNGEVKLIRKRQTFEDMLQPYNL